MRQMTKEMRARTMWNKRQNWQEDTDSRKAKLQIKGLTSAEYIYWPDQYNNLPILIEQ